MLFTIIAPPRSRLQVSHQQALSEGLKKHGIESVYSRGGSQTKHVACWGWRKGKHLRESGHEVLVMERGYLGDRFKWTSLAWNGLNGLGKFPGKTDKGERFKSNFKMKPWKKGGDYVLLLGQVPGDASLRGKDLNSWYESTANKLKEIYRLPVMFRPHPLAFKRGGRAKIPGAVVSHGTLEEALDGAAVAVTFNSNSGVDAVLAGVPTIAVDSGSMASEVASNQLDKVIRPNRDKWAAALAWKQWSMDEIVDGTALGPILEMMNA